MAEKSSFKGKKMSFDLFWQNRVSRGKMSFDLFGRIEFPSKRTKKPENIIDNVDGASLGQCQEKFRNHYHPCQQQVKKNKMFIKRSNKGFA